jgi:DNA-directed RNA polymerase subunit RPC12/RpoP
MRDIQYLYDDAGTLCAVQLSPALWAKVEAPVLAACKTPLENNVAPEPLEAWEEFKRHWDFKYPFCADVLCLRCGARTEDWEHDPAHPFPLRNAQLGGLLVFRCANCGATVRKKHFTDHTAFEASPSG